MLGVDAWGLLLLPGVLLILLELRLRLLLLLGLTGATLWLPLMVLLLLLLVFWLLLDSCRGCDAEVATEAEVLFCVVDDDDVGTVKLLLRSRVPDASCMVSNLVLSVLVIVISSLVESRLEQE